MLLCHVMLRADVFQIRIKPNSATASRDVGMNGATARKDAGGVVAGTGAMGAFVEEHRTALANDAARRTGRAPPPSPTASPNIAPRVNTRTPCGSRHAKAPGGLGNERRQVQSSQQLGAKLGQPGGLARNAPRFLPPDRKRPKTDAGS